jgi:HK97 gp10 family phage protein
MGEEGRAMKEFGSIDDFVKHLAAVAVAEQVAARRALQKCAKIVEKRAKEKVGEYQQQTGPFIAWPELAESTKADRVKHGFPEDEPLLRTGEMRDSIGRATSSDGLEVQIGSNSDIAVWQELGTQHIPPRSFLGGATADELPRIKEIMGRAFVAALIGEEVFGGRIAIEE